MATEHFIKTDPTSEPHGILGQALSLVLSPEEPGYSDTTTELMETYQKPVLQLLEIVTKTKKEKMNYMKKLEGKAVLTKESRQTYDKQLKEQDNIQPPAHPTEEPEGGCDPSFHKDPETGECVADDIEAEPDKVIEQEVGTCPHGFHDDGAGGCAADPIPEVNPPTNAPQITPEPVIGIPKIDVPTPAPAPATSIIEQSEQDSMQPPVHPVEPGGKECPIKGTHYDEEAGTCVPDLIPEEKPSTEPPATKAVEIQLPKLLSLGEPFADYKDFADCVAKNSDKEDPEAYCASIEQKVEGETVKEIAGNVYETIKHVDLKGFVRDRQLAESLNKDTKAIAQTVNAIKVLAKQSQKQQLMESRLRATYDANQTRQFNEALKKVAGAINSLNKQGISNLEKSNKDIVEQVNKGLKGLAESVNKLSTFTNTRLGQLATANAKQARKVAEQKKDYEKILEATDKVSMNKIRTLEQRVKEQEDELEKHQCGEDEHWSKEEGKCVPDAPKEEPAAEETKEKLKEMAIRIENLEAKQKGDFKGVSKPVDAKSAKTHVKDKTRTGSR